MSKSLITLIQDKTLKDIADKLVTSSVIALKQLNKVVTGKTAQSMTSEIDRDNQSASISIIGGPSLGFIIEGKKANTKLPVKKVGDKFELVQELKDWKAVVGFSGPDFLLARDIAKNARPAVDVASKTLQVFDKLHRKKVTNRILTITAQELGEQIKDQSNGTSNN